MRFVIVGLIIAWHLSAQAVGVVYSPLSPPFSVSYKPLTTGTADPATCIVGVTANFVNTSTSPAVEKACLTTNTWTAISTTGGVTSVTIAGTANQITASGTCTVTSTGTCTLSVPSDFRPPGTVSILAPTANSAAITVSSYSVTGSGTSPMVDMSGIWNTSGIVIGHKVNYTWTAANAASKLFDWQVGGTSMFNVNQSTASIATANIPISRFQTASPYGAATDSSWTVDIGYTTGTAISMASGIRLQWASNSNLASGGLDTGIARSAAGVLEANSGTVGTLRDFSARSYRHGGSAFTVSGCSASVGTGSTATAGFVTSGTTGTCTPVVTFGGSASATTGWACKVANITTPANLIQQSAYTTTTATFTGTTVSGDNLVFACDAF